MKYIINNEPASLIPGNIDEDGDVDIAATIFGDRDFEWSENDNSIWKKHVIDSNIGGVGVFVAGQNQYQEAERN